VSLQAHTRPSVQAELDLRLADAREIERSESVLRLMRSTGSRERKVDIGAGMGAGGSARRTSELKDLGAASCAGVSGFLGGMV